MTVISAIELFLEEEFGIDDRLASDIGLPVFVILVEEVRIGVSIDGTDVIIRRHAWDNDDNYLFYPERLLDLNDPQFFDNLKTEIERVGGVGP